jgi:hypothetical protein
VRRIVLTVSMLLLVSPAVANASTLVSTVRYPHLGTRCPARIDADPSPNSSWAIYQKPGTDKDYDTGVAVAGGLIYSTCWRDASLTSIPVPHGKSETVSPSAEHVVTIVDSSTGRAVTGLGALAWDPQDRVLWACREPSASSGTLPEDARDVGYIDLATKRWTPVFTLSGAQQGCDNGLAWDPTDGSLWSSTDIARYVYQQPMAGLKMQGGFSTTPALDVFHMLGCPVSKANGNGCNSGIALSSAKLFLADPQTTTKKVVEFNRKGLSSSSKGCVVAKSTMRIDGLAYDASTFSQPVVWLNFGKMDEFEAYALC